MPRLTVRSPGIAASHSRTSMCDATSGHPCPKRRSYETFLQLSSIRLRKKTRGNRGPAPVWLWRVVCRQVIEDLRFSRRIELPQVLRLLHPANHVEPGPAISALSGDDGMRMAATTMNAHHLPARIHNQPGRCVDFIRRHQCGRHQNKCHKRQSQQSLHGQAVTPTAIR